MSTPPGEVTQLTAAVDAGDQDGHRRLLTLVYQELKGLARHRLSGERAGHTLTPTALVHEVWLRLQGSALPAFRDRRHFIAVAAIAMRRVLVDHARGAQRGKRGGGAVPVTLTEGLVGDNGDPSRLLEIDDALTRLAELDPLMARVVELRYFGGLDIETAADVLSVSPRTVNRAWTAARAWLGRELATE